MQEQNATGVPTRALARTHAGQGTVIGGLLRLSARAR